MSYETTLKRARKVGASHIDDAGLMAMFCDSILQTLVGAASPSLVFEGAQKAGLTTAQLNALCLDDPSYVHELMWL